MTRVIAAVDAASPTVAETAAAVAGLLHAQVRPVELPTVAGGGRGVEAVLAELAATEVVLAVLPDGAAMEALTGPVISTWSKPVVVTPATLSTRRPLAVSRVLLALDGSEEASAAVAPTAAFLAHSGVDLVVVHVFDAATVPAFWDQAAHARRSWEPEFLARFCPQPAVRLHLRSGLPGEQVVTVATQEDVDLIALGWSQRFDHDRAATVRHTLHDARVPVLLMPLPASDGRRDAARPGTGPSAQARRLAESAVEQARTAFRRRTGLVTRSRPCRPLRVAAAVIGAAVALAACGSREQGTSHSPGAGRTPGPAPTATSPSAGHTSTSTPASPPTGGTPRPSDHETWPAGRYVATVPLPRGCLVLGPGLSGVKVYLVQRSLGIAGRREVYDAGTAAAVLRFQPAHHLPATARVDAATWGALGTGHAFCVDRFTRQPAVSAAAAASAHASAALAFARAQIRTRYIWGGAGPVGYDCSGLALQALYTGGRVVPGVTTDQHVLSAFNTAAAIYRSPAFGHVALSTRRPGDLVFWGSDFHHMALYLGSDRIVEAVRPFVRIASLWSHGTPLPDVARPFPG